MNEEQLTPLIEKYQKNLEANPKSLVFAPLAEAYRQLGFIDKAYALLKNGLKLHPQYVLAYIGIARCAVDQKNYQLSYTTLKPHIEYQRDNISLQKLFGESCLNLGYKREALETYKYLLFLNPRDKEVARIVTQLENEGQPTFSDSKAVESTQLFDLEALQIRPSTKEIDDSEWIQKDFSQFSKKEEKHEDDQWSVVKSSQESFETKIEKTTITQSISESPEREFVVEKIQIADDDESEAPVQASSERPFITHTLVDLYLNQGYFEKACELLEKILELNPDDEKTRSKYEEVRSSLLASNIPESSDNEPVRLSVVQEPEEVLDEQAQREQLMSLVEKKMNTKPKSDKNADRKHFQKLEEKLWSFHESLKKKAKEASSHHRT